MTDENARLALNGNALEVAKALEHLAALRVSAQKKARSQLVAALGPIHAGPDHLANWPVLDAALLRTLVDLPAQALADAFTICFLTVEDNFRAARIVLEELCTRGNSSAELAVVEVIQKAFKGYDSGHRPHDGTVFDLLVDTFLPNFCAEAIVSLLGQLDDDHLSLDGDGFSALIAPALARAQNDVTRANLTRLALGDRLRKIIEPTVGEKARLTRELEEGTLEIPGASDEFEEVDAKLRGAQLPRALLITYLRLLVPESGRIDPEQLAAVDLLWDLATEDLPSLQAETALWDTEPDALVELLRAASRRDDESPRFENAPLLGELISWANSLEGGASSKSKDEEISSRITWILERRPSREARARYWLSKSSMPIQLSSESGNQLRKLLGTLLKGEFHKAIHDWYTKMPRLILKDYERHEIIEIFVCSAGMTCDEPPLRDLESQLLQGADYDKSMAKTMLIAMANLGDLDRALFWYQEFLRRGGEVCWTGDPDASFTPFLTKLPGLANAISAACEIVRRAAYDGVNVCDDAVRIGLFTGAPHPTEEEVESILKSSSVSLTLIG
jgi:hypothetical protein